MSLHGFLGESFEALPDERKVDCSKLRGASAELKR